MVGAAVDGAGRGTVAGDAVDDGAAVVDCTDAVVVEGATDVVGDGVLSLAAVLIGAVESPAPPRTNSSTITATSKTDTTDSATMSAELDARFDGTTVVATAAGGGGGGGGGASDRPQLPQKSA